jgi:DNA-directed RNA polymerase subunit RPC12/RpoP
MKPFSCPACKGYMIMDDDTVAGPPGEYYFCVECGNHIETDMEHEPLEPKRPCQECGLQWATDTLVDNESDTIIHELDLCPDCLSTWSEQLEPDDAHYYPRS